eukprot:gene3230-7363_t
MVTVSLLVPVLLVLPAAVAAEKKRANVLFMMADQLRYDASGYAGNPSAITPALDRIAKEGLTMSWSGSSTPTCTPARAGILTGQSPWNHGMLGYGDIASHYPVEMPTLMAAAGYTTASFGKDHFGWNSTTNKGISHGYDITQLYDGLGAWVKRSKDMSYNDEYDQWFESVMPGKDPQATLDGWDGDGWNGWHGAPYVYPEYYHPTAWVGREAIKFIKSQVGAAKPFLAKVSFHRPHSPYDPPQRVLSKFDAATFPPIHVSDPAGKDPWDLRFRGQEGSVAFVDEQVGHIYDALVNASLLESTFILWSADHGDGQGDHYHWRKGYPYEFSAHVPMLMRWPQSYSSVASIPRGTVITGLVSELRDIFHTAVDVGDAAGLIPAGHFKPEDGKSLLCLLKDPTGATCDYAGNPGPWRQALDMEHSTCYNESNHWNALTDGSIKYVFRAFFGDEQLFNLTADKYELEELSNDPLYQDTLKKWRGLMVAQFENEGRGPNWVANGMLQQRTEGQTYSPNYPPAPPAPPAPPPKAGDVITFESVKGGASCLPSTPQCFKQVGAAIQVIGQQPGQPWCVTLDSAGTGLVVELCDPASSLQQFALLGKGDARTITTSNGAKCVGADSTARSRVVVADCPTSPSAKKADIFIFGASGRLCNSDDGCLTVDIASGRSDGGTTGTGTGTGTDTIAWPDAPTRARLGLPPKISHLN